MSVHQDTAELRSAPKPGPDYRQAFDINTAPDWVLLGLREVSRLTRRSRSTINKYLVEGRFPVPGRQGTTRVWTVKQVRDYCAGLASETGEAK